MSERTIFFTGFPGFIGRFLLNELIEDNPANHFILLVQSKFLSEAIEQTAKIKKQKEQSTEIEVLAGDISLPMLGLSDKKYEELLNKVTDVFHLAAIYDLAVPEQIARKVNVTGTENMTLLCKSIKNLRAFVYFSTCYVAGKRTGTIYEDELEMGQGFKNHYEATKFEAEVIVRKSMKEIPTIIIRPGIVVGHSKTGEINKFDGPYFGMILIDALKILRIPLPYLGESDAEVNLVPIDYVVKAVVSIWKKEGTTGKTYQLADPNPVLAKTLYAEIIRLLGAKGPFLKIPPLVMDLPLRLSAIRKMLGVPREVLEYFNHKCHFDSTNTQNALKGTGIEVPHLLDYLPVLVDFYKKNKHRKELRWKAY